MGNIFSYQEEESVLSVSKLGQIKGITLSKKVAVYKAIPYALPPTGQYRWKKPRPLPRDYSYSSASGEPLDCTEFAPLAPQPQYTKLANDEVPHSEERCLNLNIWVPVGVPKPAEGYPVYIWLHGGWLQVGNPNSSPSMDPTELISSGGLHAVFVAIGYRLSALGFMASSALKKESEEEGGDGCYGNYGFHDQRCALEWVYDHIESFGGDNTKITLAGRSAGAYSTHAQAVYDFFGPSKEERRVFNKMVMVSNAIPNDAKTLEDLDPQYDELLQACDISLSLSSTAQLAALRGIPSKELMVKIMTLKHHTFRACEDGLFFPENLMERFKSGEFAKVFKERNMKLIIGEVRDEETIYRETNPPTDMDESMTTEVANYYPLHIVHPLIDLYKNKKIKESAAHPDPNPNISPEKKLFGDIISDGQVRAPSRLLIRELAENGVPLSSVNRYMINWRAKFSRKAYDETWGVGHAFDIPLWNYSVMHDPEPQEIVLMKKWIDDLSAFVMEKPFDYGTRAWDEYKVITPEGTIEIQKDLSWEYLETVADVMGTK